MQIEGLPVVPEMALVQRGSVEPCLTCSSRTRAEVDLGPPGNGRWPRDIVRSVVHEGDQVGPRGLGAPRCAEGREVTVGEISREIGGQILEPGAHAKARIRLGPGARGGNQQKRVQHSTDATHRWSYLSGNCRDAESARNMPSCASEDAFSAVCGGFTARYTVLHSCAALDSSASAAAAPNGATRKWPASNDHDHNSELLMERVALMADHRTCCASRRWLRSAGATSPRCSGRPCQ